MNSTWKAVLGVLLVFILGWVAGALCSGLYFRQRVLDVVHRGPDAIAGLLEQRLTHNLRLDDRQRQQIHGFILENLHQRKALLAKIQPDIQTTNRQMLDEINSLLNPDQRVLLHANLIEFRQRYGKNPFNPNADVGEAPPASNPPPAPAGMETNSPTAQ